MYAPGFPVSYCQFQSKPKAVITMQESAEGIVATEVAKARTMEENKDGEFMRAKRQNNQLEPAFGNRSEGEARSEACEGSEVCVAQAETESPAAGPTMEVNRFILY